jgi:tetratricopeptide (TPR) repeat protein
MDSNLDQLIDRGKRAFEHRDYVTALANFQEVIERNPRYPDIRHLTGLCLSFVGQTEDALREFEAAVALNDSYVEAHLNRAITLNELGRYDDAREAFGRATELEQGRSEKFPAAVSAKLANAHLHVGDLYMAANAPVEAANEYRAALGMRPRFTDIRNKLATALLQLGRLEEAEHELTVALEHNPRYLEARLNLGLARFRRGDVPGAREQWGAAREQSPEDAQVRAYWSLIEE